MMRPMPPPASGRPSRYTLDELYELAAMLTPETPALEGPPEDTARRAKLRAQQLQAALWRVEVQVRTRTWAERRPDGSVRWCWAVYLPGDG
jgi:hypothetical protein